MDDDSCSPLLPRREVRLAVAESNEPRVTGSPVAGGGNARKSRRSIEMRRSAELQRDGEAWNVAGVVTEVRKNVGAGLTVALVNMPLSISLGVAAAATPTMGCLTAIWAGMTSAILGGSQYNIVGPTGALSGLLSQASVNWGDPSILPILSIMSGLVCLLIFALRLDKYAQFVPASVMEGFTIGVACIIALNQLNFAMGLGKLTPHSKFVDNVVENLTHAVDAKWQSVVLFFTFFFGQLFLRSKFGRVPWPVLLAAVGILIGYLDSDDGGHVINLGKDFHLQTLDTRYSNLTMSLYEFPTFDTSRFKLSVLQSLFSTSCSIALVVILETLISARIADQMTKTHFNQRQEVLAISLANISSGIFGGIPATAALARTALNVKSGATGRMAAIICTIATACLSVLLMPFFRFLPLPVVAAILANVSYGMLDPKEIVHIYEIDREQFFLMIFVAFLVVFVDTTVGILAGTIISMLNFVGQVSAGRCTCTLWHGDKQIVEFEAEQVIQDHAMPMIFQRQRMMAANTQMSHTNRDADLENRIFCKKSNGMGGSNSAIEMSFSRDTLLASEEEERRQEGMSEEGKPHEGYELVLEYKIDGKINFVTAETHSKRLRAIGEPSLTLLVNLAEVTKLDVDGIFILQVLFEELASHSRRVLICGVTKRTKHTLKKAQFFTDMERNGLVINNYLSNLPKFVGKLPDLWVEDNQGLIDDVAAIEASSALDDQDS